MTSLSMILAVAGAIIIVLVVFVELKKRSNQKAEQRWMQHDYHDESVFGETEALTEETGERVADEDGIIGEARIVKSADTEPEPMVEVFEDETIDIAPMPTDDAFSVTDSTDVQEAPVQAEVPTVQPPLQDPPPVAEPEIQEELPQASVESLDEEIQHELDFDTPQEEKLPQAEEALIPSAHETMVALTVMADAEDSFEGADLLREFTSQNLTLGNDGFYHRPVPGLPHLYLFSVANVMEPGTLRMEEMRELKTKGLLLFMRLPNKLTPVQAFEQFYDAADSLAVTLGGQVCDQQRNVLGGYRLEQMRDDMRHLEMKLEIEAKQRNR